VQIEPNFKYSCWFFSGAGVAKEVGDDVLVAERTYVTRHLGVALEDHWAKWLGTLVVDSITPGGLALYVTAPAKEPRVVDGETQALDARADEFLYGLLLQGVPRFEMCFRLSGSRVKDDVDVRGYTPSRDLIPTWGIEPFIPDLETLRRAARIGRRLRQMQESGQWRRLLRCVGVLLEANRVTNTHGERFHQFVRVLDGLVKTREGRGGRDFAHRVQTFAIANEETREALLEMFAARGRVEHVNVLTDALKLSDDAHPQDQQQMRLERANLLCLQADILARAAVCRLLEDDDLFDQVRNEDTIDAFWATEDDERARRFGSRVDLQKIARWHPSLAAGP
jgi:hypothetical protein